MQGPNDDGSRTIMLRITSSFRIEATSATFFGFPAATSRVQNALITGLCRAAVSVAMYRVERTRALPQGNRISLSQYQE